MANLNEIAQWEEGIYRIEQTDPVVGGNAGSALCRAETGA